jgi:type I restriction enzyme, S subunit
MMVRRAKVGELLRLERRFVAVVAANTYAEIGIRSFGKGIFHKESVTGADLGSKRVFAIHPGDLVLSNVFAWEGAIALATDAESGRIGSHRFMTYVSVSDDVCPSYLRYLFLSERGLALIAKASPGSAGRNKTLAIDRFEALDVPLPEVAEQRRLAGRIDRATAAIARLESLSGAQTRVANALASSLAQRYDLSEETKTRRGWHRTRLGEVLTTASCAHPVDGTTLYLNAGVLSFGRGLFEKPPIEGATTSARTLNRLRAGQLVYSRLFAFEGAYAEVTPRFDGYFVSNEFPAFDLDATRALAGFVAAYLRSPTIWAELARGSKGLGLRRQRILVETLLEYRIWLPPLEEQERILSAVTAISRCGEKRAVSDGVLSALRKSLLNRAFENLL